MNPASANDLAVIIVSTNDASWLEACLPTVFARAGTLDLDVIIVDNESTDGTCELVESRFPDARVLRSRNGGFANANNRGLASANARYVLFLNPDTEVIEGTFEALVEALDARPHVGLIGVRQLTPDGKLFPTIRRFPNAARALGEALASERWPVHPAWAGERVLDPAIYEREQECDWTSGSFMLARREALLSAGFMDERFFLQCEEPDLCLRIKRAGWSVRHLPTMTIIHHADKGGIRPRMAAQEVYARRQYAHKHFSRPHRALYLSAVAARHALRLAAAARFEDSETHRSAARAAIRALGGRAEPPFVAPPQTALRTFEAPRTSAEQAP
jgi:GT2 family glycosyltransferase